MISKKLMSESKKDTAMIHIINKIMETNQI